MKKFDVKHKRAAIDNYLGMDIEYDMKNPPQGKRGLIYGDVPVMHIIYGGNTKSALKLLQFTADWFEHPHPSGRDTRGEADFTAIRLISALYSCYDKLTDRIRESLRRFYLQRDFSSIYSSENHSLMYRVARYLSAQFYKNDYFEQFDMSAGELMQRDGEYINEFIKFRAKKGWGEFDSYGYAGEIMLILNTLYYYVENNALKEKAKMMMDIILVDMIADSKGVFYGGAHGRIYPISALDSSNSTMFKYYTYYFGGEYYKEGDCPNCITALSDYVPSKIVYEIEERKTYPYENRERKHLHCCSCWQNEIKWDRLDKVIGSINKYTYVCKDYIIGAVNHQDDYPKDDYGDFEYAHHQQHEWELTLLGGTTHKIFSHHPGDPGYHHIHNRWTGDFGCCCGTYYANKNTVFAIYNIVKENEYPYINAYVPLDIFSEKLLEEKYIFLRYEKLFIMLYFHEGYRINQEDEFANIELLSYGRQNAVVCRVGYRENFTDIQNFADTMKSKVIVFENLKLRFDGTEVYYNGNSENNEENKYPYSKTYDCPYMQSDWDSGIIELISGTKRIVYDFNE